MSAPAQRSAITASVSCVVGPIRDDRRHDVERAGVNHHPIIT